jgi:hypothetical protein
MEYILDFNDYESYPTSLKLGMQKLAISTQYKIVCSNNFLLSSLTFLTNEVVVNSFLTANSMILSTRSLVNTLSNQKALIVFDSNIESLKNIIEEGNYTKFYCLNEKVVPKLKKHVPNCEIITHNSNIVTTNYSQNSLKNIFVVTETEAHIMLIIRLVKTFYMNSDLHFYIISSCEFKAELKNISIISPNIIFIETMRDKCLVNLSNKTGFSLCIQYFKDNNYQVASIEDTTIQQEFDNLLYFSENKLNNLYMVIDIIKKQKPPSQEFITLIIQGYNESNQERKTEIEQAITMNLQNSFIKSIVCFMESDDVSFSHEIMNHPKIKIVLLGKWITFADIFSYVNIHYTNEYIGIINIDIALDSQSNWKEMISYVDNKKVLALSRYEYKENKIIELDESFGNIFHCHTQDGWFFKSPINVQNCNFELGTLGCDNALADRFFKSGFPVLNMMETFKLLHIDNVRGKNSSNFLEHHKEKQNQHPEKSGYRLLPNFEKVKSTSLDSIFKQLNVSDIDRYNIVCDIFSQLIKINN